MKSPVLSSLYVFSIVLAVGIGMKQMAGETPTFGGDVPKCTTKVIIHPSCEGNFQICKKLPLIMETSAFMPKNAIDLVRIAGPPSGYQCYLDGLPCDIEQPFTYKSAPTSCQFVQP